MMVANCKLIEYDSDVSDAVILVDANSERYYIV